MDCGSNGTRELVAEGWISNTNAVRDVRTPEIVAVSPQNLKCTWSVVRTYPSPHVEEIFYCAKVNGRWDDTINCTEDPLFGYYPNLARIIRNAVLCLANNKIYATYPNFPFEPAILVADVNNYDAISIPSGAFMGTAAIVYSKNTNISGLYKICFTIKAIPHILPYKEDIVYSPPPGPPEEFTAYNNSRRLLRDNQGTLHLAFTSGDSVYHTFLQDTSWSEPVAIGQGKYPALTLDNSGKIYCVWSYNGGPP
ncbi:MAG: hypothetical protein ACUVTF_07335, partial [bacterium]